MCLPSARRQLGRLAELGVASKNSHQGSGIFPLLFTGQVLVLKVKPGCLLPPDPRSLARILDVRLLRVGRFPDQLEAGEPVVVAGWQISEWLPVRPDANAHFRLEADGSLTPVRPVHRDDVVVWEE